MTPSALLPFTGWNSKGRAGSAIPPEYSRITATSVARIRLTRHKISDRWRERAWLPVQCGSQSKRERGAASGSLDRLVRRFAAANSQREDRATDLVISPEVDAC